MCRPGGLRRRSLALFACLALACSGCTSLVLAKGDPPPYAGTVTDAARVSHVFHDGERGEALLALAELPFCFLWDTLCLPGSLTRLILGWADPYRTPMCWRAPGEGEIGRGASEPGAAEDEGEGE